MSRKPEDDLELDTGGGIVPPRKVNTGVDGAKAPVNVTGDNGSGMSVLGNVLSLVKAAEPDGFVPDVDDGFVPDTHDDGFTPDVQSLAHEGMPGAAPDLAPQTISNGVPVGAPGIPDLLKRPEEPAQPNPYDGMMNDPLVKLAFGKSLEDSNPLAIPSYVVEKFSDVAIRPVIRWLQAKAQNHYLNEGQTNSAPIGTPGLGQTLRNLAPGGAHLVETGLKPYIGESSFNSEDTEKLDPALLGPKGGLEQNRKDLGGDVGAATAEFLVQGLGNLPFYVIPGVGEEATMQGATGGFMSALADPDANLLTATVGGATLGAGLEGAGKLLQKARTGAAATKVAAGDAARAAAKKLAAKDISVGPVTDDYLRQLARGPAVKQNIVAIGKPTEIAEAAARLTPAEPVPGLATPRSASLGVVDVTPEGKVVRRELTLTPEGPKARDLTKAEGFRSGQPVIGTDAANRAREADAAGEVAQAFWEVGPDGHTAKPGQWMPAHVRLMDLQDWDATANNRKIMEGLALVSDGDGGTARLTNIESHEFKKEILRQRQLMSVTLRDGSEHLGFYGSGHVLVKPDADEFIPRAAQMDMNLEGNPDVVKVKVINGDSDLTKVLLYGEDARLAAKGEAARQAADASAAQADVMLGGDGSGGKLPPAPPRDPPPPPPPNPHNVDPSEGVKVPWAQMAFGKLNAYAQRKLLNPSVRGAQDVADLAFASHSIDTFERLRSDVLKSFEKFTPEIRQMPVQQQRQALSSLDRYLVGDIDKAKLLSLHPELNKGVADEITKYKTQIAKNQERLKDLGILSTEKHFDELGDEVAVADYATRMYYRWLMKPGEWARMFKKDTHAVGEVKRAIMNEVYTKGKYASGTYSTADRKALVDDHFDYLVGEPKIMERARIDPESAWKQTISKAGGSLKQRQDLTWWKRMALGEVDNPFVRAAEAMSRQNQLIVMGEMMQSAANNPALSSAFDDVANARLRGHTEPVPANPALYGKLAGRQVSPEAWEALVQAPLAQKNASHVMSKFVNAMKFNQTVGNPGSWVTNFFANAQGIALSNLVNPLASPYKVGNGMLHFVRDLKAYRLAPGVEGTVRGDRFTNAMKHGWVGSDYSTAEFRESATLWERTLENEARNGEGKVNPLNMFPRLLKEAGSVITGVGQTQSKSALAKKYGAIDSMWKYAAGTAGLEKGGIDLSTGQLKDVEKAIKFIGGRYRPNMTDARILENVWLEVTQRIHYSFPMLDRVGEGVAQAGKYTAAVNPYLKVKAEMMRNYAQLPGRMHKEPGQTANLMSWAATIGGAFFGLQELRKRAGVNQQEVDAAFASAPDAVQRFKPGAMALWDRAPNGKVRLIDMTQMFEPLTWLQGNPDDAAPVRFLQNIAISPIDGSLLEPEMAQILSQSGWIDAAYARPHIPEWQQGGAKLLTDTFGRLGPGIWRNSYATAERGGVGFEPKGVKGAETQPVSPAVTAFNAIAGPNRIIESGGPDDRTRAIQAKVREIDEAEKKINNIGPMNDGQSTGMMSLPLNKAEAMVRARQVIEQKKKELAALQHTLRR